jgi:hypothetical protein
MGEPLTSNPEKLSANSQWVRRISAEWRDESKSSEVRIAKPRVYADWAMVSGLGVA